MGEGIFPPQTVDPERNDTRCEAEMGGMDVARSPRATDWIKTTSFMASSWATAICPPFRPSAINPSLSPPSNRIAVINAAITRLSWLPLASLGRLNPSMHQYCLGGCPLVGNPPAGIHPFPGIRLGDWVSQTSFLSLYLVRVPLY